MPNTDPRCALIPVILQNLTLLQLPNAAPWIGEVQTGWGPAPTTLTQTHLVIGGWLAFTELFFARLFHISAYEVLVQRKGLGVDACCTMNDSFGFAEEWRVCRAGRTSTDPDVRCAERSLRTFTWGLLGSRRWNAKPSVWRCKARIKSLDFPWSCKKPLLAWTDRCRVNQVHRVGQEFSLARGNVTGEKCPFFMSWVFLIVSISYVTVVLRGSEVW